MNYPPGIKWSEIRKELYSPEELECADKVVEIMKKTGEIPNEALTPSPGGRYCQHNGDDPDYECCCDECDFFLACFPDWEEKLKNGMKTPLSECFPEKDVKW